MGTAIFNIKERRSEYQIENCFFSRYILLITN